MSRSPFTIECALVDEVRAIGPRESHQLQEALRRHGYLPSDIAYALRRTLDKGLLRLGTGLRYEIAEG